MISDYPENWFQSKPFNLADWASSADGFPSLRNYARVDVSNVWRALQRFPTLEFVLSLNGISAATFAFLGDVTSSIQGQFGAVAARLRHMFTSDDATAFEGKVVTNTLVANNLTVNDIECGVLQAVEVTATTLRARSVVADNLLTCWVFDEASRSYPVPSGTTLVATLSDCVFRRGAVRATLPAGSTMTLTTASGVVLWQRTNDATATLHRVAMAWNGVFVPHRIIVQAA